MHFSNIPNVYNEDDALSTTSRNFIVNRRPIGNISEDMKNNMSNSGVQYTRPPNRPRIRLRRTQTAHNLDVSIKKGFEYKRTQTQEMNMGSTAMEHRNGRSPGSASDTKRDLPAATESPSHTPSSVSTQASCNTNGGTINASNLSKTTDDGPPLCSDKKDSSNNIPVSSIPENKELSDHDKIILNSTLKQNTSSISSENNLVNNRFRIGRRASTISRTEVRQREAMWDLFQSENAFLIDHLMVLKHVSRSI